MGTNSQTLTSTATDDTPLPSSSAPTATAIGKHADGRVALFFLPVLTGALLWLCYFPVGWGWLAWIALVPLLRLVRMEARAWKIAMAAWVGGLVVYVPALQWIRLADERNYISWPILAVYCSLYLPLAILLVRRLDARTRLPLVITVPAVWTALEFLRSELATGFPWYFLAHTQHDALAVIQISDLTGAYGVTFLVVAVNAALAELLWSPSRRAACLQAGGVALALVATLLYGASRLGQIDFTPGPTVALVQGNLDQQIRNAADQEDRSARFTLRHYREISDQAMERHPDLIIWPETSYPDEWHEVEPGMSRDDLSIRWRDNVDQSRETAWLVARRWPTNVVLGLNARVLRIDGSERKYNSAVLIRSDGLSAGRYDKIHRVPFGEYVPLRDWLPWLEMFAPYDNDYSIHVGDGPVRFPIHTAHGDWTFGTIICFEDSDPKLARAYVSGQEPAVNFLVNMSNDGWFNGSSEHEEHLAICRFRAVECRRAVARAVNMGISAVIDANGRIVALPGPTWSTSKKIPGVVDAVIPIDNRTSFYAAWGDWLPWSCWLVVMGGLVTTMFRHGPHRTANEGVNT
jgi:apolipoprotein N-acyltransferase